MLSASDGVNWSLFVGMMMCKFANTWCDDVAGDSGHDGIGNRKWPNE